MYYKNVALAIVGSRGLHISKGDIRRYVKQLEDAFYIKVTKVVSGGARGIDHCAELYAKQYRKKLEVYKPDWDKYGKRAGFIRNELIINNADYVLAFWNGESKGTLDSIRKAHKLKKLAIVYILNDERTHEHEYANGFDPECDGFDAPYINRMK
jgi:hypothetical protein